MDESALKMVLDSLDKSRSSLDVWMTVWTWLVVIGVIAEVAFVVHAYSDSMSEWRRGIVRPPDRPSRRWFVMELLAVALVAAGVSGELYVENRAGKIETQIRSANDQRTLLLQKEAGDAKHSAAKAAVDAGTASTLASNTKMEADSFQRDIVSAKTLAANAESHLADALERAAKAESESAKAQAELARLTAPIQSVPVINGIAEPDPTKGLRLRILLHTDVRIKLPTLPKGKSVSWTLFIVQDEKGDHQFSTFPHDVMFGNWLAHAPRSFCTMALVTDEHGTTDLTFGAANCPSNATETTTK